MAHIGIKIREYREKLGMSQEELALKLGYKSRSTINKIEMGINDITQSKIIAFAKALNTTPDSLMDFGYNEVFGESLKDLRESKGLTPAELANLYNQKYPPKMFEDPITSKVINLMERGKIEITYQHALRFSDIMGATPDCILVSWSSAFFQEAEQQRRLINIFESLSEERKEELIDYAIYLSKKQK